MMVIALTSKEHSLLAQQHWFAYRSEDLQHVRRFATNVHIMLEERHVHSWFYLDNISCAFLSFPEPKHMKAQLYPRGVTAPSYAGVASRSSRGTPARVRLYQALYFVEVHAQGASSCWSTSFTYHARTCMGVFEASQPQGVFISALITYSLSHE